MKFSIKEKIFWAGLLVTSGISYLYFSALHEQYLSINSFEECVASHFVVLPTYPEVCILPGKHFVNTKQALTKKENATRPDQSVFPYENLNYTIEDQLIQFRASTAIREPDALLKRATTTYTFIGKPFVFNGTSDDRDDYIIVAEASSSKGLLGYYAFAALSLKNEYIGTNGIYLGKNLNSVLYSASGTAITLRTKEVGSSKEIKHDILVTSDNLLKEINP